MGPSAEASAKIEAKDMTSASTSENREATIPVHAGTTFNNTILTPTTTKTTDTSMDSVTDLTELASNKPYKPAGGEQPLELVTKDESKTAPIPSTLEVTTTSATATGFTMFLKFPAEIRNIVWELAASNHRHDPSRLVFLYNCSRIECPTILLVNGEAKNRAAKYFQKLRKFKPVREGDLNGALATKILVNPARDILTYLNPNMGSHSAPFKRLIYQCAAEGIQYLALSSTWVSIFLEDGFYMAAVDNLMEAGNLKGLFVVRQDTLRAGESNVQLVNSNTLADWLYKDSIEADLEEAGERRGWEWEGNLTIARLEAIPSEQVLKSVD